MAGIGGVRFGSKADMRDAQRMSAYAVDHCVRLALTEQPRRWWFKIFALPNCIFRPVRGGSPAVKRMT
jgi:hypothetical protein